MKSTDVRAVAVPTAKPGWITRRALIIYPGYDTLQSNRVVAETWRRVWGDGKNFRGPFFGKSFRFHAQKFWWPFFSHRPGFSDFRFLFQILRIFTVLNVEEYDLSSQEKPHFRAHPTTLLLKISGERMHWPSPVQIFWGPSPQPPT